MKTSLIKFYAVGLNEQNLAFNLTAFNNILRAGRFLQGNVERSITLNQPVAFGAPFQISAQYYYIFKRATYLLIQNTVDNRTYSRYGFINNFLELSNGNYSVSYTLDDYTNYILHASDLGVSPHIDGFIERANVPLIKKVGNNYQLCTREKSLTGAIGDNGQYKKVYNCVDRSYNIYGQPLPSGYTCAVYFISSPKVNGSPIDANAHGTVLDENVTNGTARTIYRNNSNIYYMIFDNNGLSVRTLRYRTDNNDYQIENHAGALSLYGADDSTIEKIMYFDYLPEGKAPTPSYGFQKINGSWAIVLGANPYDVWKKSSADIGTSLLYGNPSYPDERLHVKAAAVLHFACVRKFDLPTDTALKFENSNITKATQYNNYIANSLYQYINEVCKYKIVAYTAEIDFPIEKLFANTNLYFGYSGDGETIILKYYSTDLTTPEKSNRNASTGQNINYFDLVQVRDFKAYKNAKITGAAGIAATAVGSVVALGSSIATGNVAGVVGALSGGAQGIISGVQKLQGLTPQQQSPANGDFTLTQMLNDINGDKTPIVSLIIETYLPEQLRAKIIDLEENGAAVSMPFDEYINNCQMEAYNAIKCAYMDITGIPQQAARRIADAFISGVTLWTTTDVGNKKVINYPAE